MFRKGPIANIDEGEVAEDAIPENKIHGPCKISDKKPSKLPGRQKSRRKWNREYFQVKKFK